MNRLEDLREWLLSQIDGSEETRGDDSLISHFIRQIDALPSEMGTIPTVEREKVMDAQRAATVEPRGCPTPGSCSAVAEIADIKQRLLPQFQGRTQRAEHERDALLEQLIEARSAIQQSYGCLWRYTGSSNPMFLQARKMLLARLTKEQQASGIRYANELFGHTTEHEILHSDCSHDAAPSATAATDFFNFLESAAQDIDYNPEGGGELSGVEAVLEFLHEPLVYEVLNRKAAPVEETAPKGSALNTLDIIANWGDEENEWDAVVKYRSVRDMAKTRVAILRSYMKQRRDDAEERPE